MAVVSTRVHEGSIVPPPHDYDRSYCVCNKALHSTNPSETLNAAKIVASPHHPCESSTEMRSNSPSRGGATQRGSGHSRTNTQLPAAPCLSSPSSRVQSTPLTRTTCAGSAHGICSAEHMGTRFGTPNSECNDSDTRVRNARLTSPPTTWYFPKVLMIEGPIDDHRACRPATTHIGCAGLLRLVTASAAPRGFTTQV